MKRLTCFLVAALVLGLFGLPLVSVPVQGAIITINTDTYWTTSQTNTDGYIVNGGATLYICANGSAGDIVIVHGDAGLGDFTIEDDARIVFITGNNSNVIYMGGSGVAPNQANLFHCVGIFETIYLGDNAAPTVNIGRGATGNKTIDNMVVVTIQPAHTIENVWLLTDYAYITFNHLADSCLWRNSNFGDGTEPYGIRADFASNVWVEDTDWDFSIRPFYTYNGFSVNIIGELETHGKGLILEHTYSSQIYYWSRLYPKVIDTLGNPIDNATITVADRLGGASWTAFSNTTGEVNTTISKFNRNWLLALNQSTVESSDYPYYDGFLFQNHSTDASPSVITVTATGYYANITTHNMSLDWGTLSSPISFELEAIPGYVNQSVRTYSDANTTILDSRFQWGETAYVNGTMALSYTVTNVNVNVTVFNDTNASVGYLLGTTHSFTADLPVNLTELNGGSVLNYTVNRTGQLYVRLRTWKTGEVPDSNVTEDFIVENDTAPGTPGSDRGGSTQGDLPEEVSGDLSLFERLLAENPGVLLYLTDTALGFFIIGLVILFCYGLVRFASKKEDEGG